LRLRGSEIVHQRRDKRVDIGLCRGLVAGCQAVAFLLGLRPRLGQELCCLRKALGVDRRRVLRRFRFALGVQERGFAGELILQLRTFALCKDAIARHGRQREQGDANPHCSFHFDSSISLPAK
jgi:hypothetical protein